jgi:hypothetical protein
VLKERHPEATRFILYLGNARYYHTGVVKEWLGRHPEFHLRPLPPYSPNLNLIERLWKLLRKEAFTRWHQTACQAGGAGLLRLPGVGGLAPTRRAARRPVWPCSPGPPRRPRPAPAAPTGVADGALEGGRGRAARPPPGPGPRPLWPAPHRAGAGPRPAARAAATGRRRTHLPATGTTHTARMSCPPAPDGPRCQYREPDTFPTKGLRKVNPFRNLSLEQARVASPSSATHWAYAAFLFR